MAPHFDRLAVRLGALFGFFAVVLGALAAHPGDRCVYDFLERNGRLNVWHTALFQQWVHALALVAVGQSLYAPRATVVCWLIGTVLFSGSLYILALDSTQKWAGPLTPLGGLFLLAGWAWLWFRLIGKPA